MLLRQQHGKRAFSFYDYCLNNKCEVQHELACPPDAVKYSFGFMSYAVRVYMNFKGQIVVYLLRAIARHHRGHSI